MPVYPYDNRPLHCVESGTRFRNPSSWKSQRTVVTEHLVVGFTGDTSGAHTMDELVAIVETIVHEDGAQVLIVVEHAEEVARAFESGSAPHGPCD